MFIRLKNETVYHVKSEEEAEEFLKQCEAQHISWATGTNATSHTNYSEYGKNTCYYIDSDYMLTYGSVGGFERDNVRIVDFSTLLKEARELHKQPSLEDDYENMRKYIVDALMEDANEIAFTFAKEIVDLKKEVVNLTNKLALAEKSRYDIAFSLAKAICPNDDWDKVAEEFISDAINKYKE